MFSRRVPSTDPYFVDHALEPTEWNVGNQKRGALFEYRETTLKKAGYKYINLDDCWMKIQKDSKGRQVPDPLKFPPSQPGLTDGIEIVANYLTNLKLQMGIYTAMGPKTCAGHAGSCGSEVLDTTEYNAWNMSYLKIDACGGCGDPLIDTAKLRKGFPNKLVQVHPSTDVVAVSANPNKYGNARRIGHDMMPTWFSMLSLVDASSGLHKFAHNDSGLGGFYFFYFIHMCYTFINSTN